MADLLLDGALQRLCEWRNEVDSEALEVVRSNWEEALPILLHEIESGEPEDLDRDIPHPLFHAALFLCGELQETRAFEPLLERCAKEDAGDGVLQHLPMHKLGAVLAACGSGNVERLLACYNDPETPEFGRVAALYGLFHMRLAEAWPEEAAKRWFGDELVRLGGDASGLKSLLAALLSLAAEVVPDVVEDMAEKMAELHLPEGNRDGATKLLKLMAKLGRQDADREFYSIGNADEELEELGLDYVEDAGFSEIRDLLGDPDALLLILDEDQEREIVEIENVGRNEPCPCGSGKKFKKCCIGKAEIVVPVSRSSHLGTTISGKDRVASEFMQAGYMYWKEGDDLAQLACWVICAEVLKPLIGGSAASPAAVEQRGLFVGYASVDDWMRDFCRLVFKMHAAGTPDYVAAMLAMDWFLECFPGADSELLCDVRTARALMFILEGRLDDAVRYLRKVLCVKPDHFLARGILGECLNSMGRREETIALFEEGKALPKAPPAFAEALRELEALTE